MAIERLYDVAETAQTFRVSKWTVWKWLELGILRGTKVNGRRVFRESELERLIVDDPKRNRKDRELQEA